VLTAARRIAITTDVMDSMNDPRTTTLLAAVGDRLPQPLLERLLRSFDELEQTDFGELEPVGVAAPITPRAGQ
jgi:hypothetical protein